MKILLGGVIYEKDFQALKQMGVAGIFVSGTPLEDIVTFVRQLSALPTPKVEEKAK